MHMSLPCPGSGQLQGNYKGSMVMSKGPLTSIGSCLNTISVKYWASTGISSRFSHDHKFAHDHPFDPKVSIYGNTHVIQTNVLSTPHSSFHHLHTQKHIPTYYNSSIIHVSTRTCHIHHKRGVTEVWHIAHFWVSYQRCATHGLPMG